MHKYVTIVTMEIIKYMLSMKTFYFWENMAVMYHDILHMYSTRHAPTSYVIFGQYHMACYITILNTA